MMPKKRDKETSQEKLKQEEIKYNWDALISFFALINENNEDVRRGSHFANWDKIQRSDLLNKLTKILSLMWEICEDFPKRFTMQTLLHFLFLAFIYLRYPVFLPRFLFLLKYHLLLF